MPYKMHRHLGVLLERWSSRGAGGGSSFVFPQRLAISDLSGGTGFGPVPPPERYTLSLDLSRWRHSAGSAGTHLAPLPGSTYSRESSVGLGEDLDNFHRN